MTAVDIEAPPVIPWADWFGAWRWRQDEHLSVIGHTGCGKTTLLLALAERRDFPIVIGTKPRDPALSALRRQGWQRVDELPRRGFRRGERARVLLWPRYHSRLDRPRQRQLIGAALDAAFVRQGWCIVVDEVAYLERELRLGDHLRTIWQQGRSNNVCLAGATQRPAHVPRDMYSEARHVFLFRSADAADRRRLAQIGGAVDTRQLARIVGGLPKHHWLYVDAHTGDMAISKVEV